MKLTVPGPTVGIVGGGQLGRMLGEAAGPLGVDLITTDPTPDPPAAPVVSDTISGEFDDPETIDALAARADVLTYEIELADPDVLERAGEEHDTPVHPAPETLRTIQDKLVQKRRLEEAGIPVPEFRAVDSPDDLRDALDDLGYPGMLKAREGGYDGRGNLPVESPAEVEEAFAAIDGPAMVEEFVPFDRELSVIGVRGADENRTFAPGENIHEEEILRETVVPARVSAEVRERATAVARDVLDLLDGRGVFGIELFETSEARSVVRDGETVSSSREAQSASRTTSNSSSGRSPREDGEISVNEIAPRPHNSGHWTIEGARTSQFEQHLRAILGWPLGATDRRENTVMKNFLGDVEEPTPAALSGIENVLAEPGANLHWYGKREARPLRKLGHVTLTDDADSTDDLLARARDLVDSTTFR